MDDDRRLPRPGGLPRVNPRPDSLLPEADREWLARLIRDENEKLRREFKSAIDNHEERLREVEGLRSDIGSLATDVRAVLRSDAQQEHRLSAVELRMVEASRSAGSRAGVSAGALGSVIAAAILYALQQLSGQQPSPVVPHRPTMPAPVTQPPQ